MTAAEAQIGMQAFRGDLIWRHDAGQSLTNAPPYQLALVQQISVSTLIS